MTTLSSLLVLLLALGQTWGGSSVEGGRTSPDGFEEIQIDLPAGEHLKNTGGRDGAGLCVFTSVEHAGRWQNVSSVGGFQAKMTKELGGGYPSKLEKMMSKYCGDAQYLQYEGTDPSLIKLALATCRMPAVTYGYSPRYGPGKIAHMVNVAHLSDKWAAVLDNNFPGDHRYEWMSPEEFRKRWISGGGGWAVFLLAPPPPPLPGNKKRETLIGSRWGDQGCPSVEGESSSEYNWVEFGDGDPDQIALYRKTVQAGVWSRQGRYYRPILKDGTFGPRQETAPLAPPQKKIEQGAPLFGVVREKLDQGEKFSIGGREIDRTRACQILKSGGNLDDDRSKLRLTVIGSESECAAVSKDLRENPELKRLSDHCLIQCYRPTDWAVADIGFSAGAPRIVVQEGPDKEGVGRVLHSQGDYAGGAVELAQALRRVRPDYDPSKDPDKRKEDAPASPAAEGISFFLMIAAGVATCVGLPWLAAILRPLSTLAPVLSAAKKQPEPAVENKIAKEKNAGTTKRKNKKTTSAVSKK